ncbi:ATP-binding protein [Pantoea ananatis]
MNNEEILENLKSLSPEKRYEAAKYLAGNQEVSLENELKIAREKETVGYIRSTFSIALTRLQTCKNNEELVEEVDKEQDLHKSHNIAHQKGMDEMASMFIHELENVVGRLAVTTKKEINNYQNSQTKIQIESLRNVIEALTQIKEVNKSKNTEGVNLEQFINEIVFTEFKDFVSAINISGRLVLNCVCDKSLLRMAVVNGIRNALESSADCNKDPEVNISWGETNIDWFIKIRDNGLGLTMPLEQLVKKKVTTKDYHLGYGLLIITKAIERIDGNWTLENDPADGANLTLRWNK